MPSRSSANDPQLEYSEHPDDNTPLALVRRADGENGLFLRVDPTIQSDLYKGSTRRICNGDMLVLLDWDPIQGFLAVAPKAKNFMGYIRASHIEYVIYREIHYKLFHPDDDLWWQSEWNFDSSKCWVRVQETIADRRNWEDLVKHLNEIGVERETITDDLLAHWSDKATPMWHLS